MKRLKEETERGPTASNASIYHLIESDPEVLDSSNELPKQMIEMIASDFIDIINILDV